MAIIIEREKYDLLVNDLIANYNHEQLAELAVYHMSDKDAEERIIEIETENLENENN